jgi:hypothetical protein
MPAAVALLGAVGSVTAGVAAGGIIGGVMVAGGVMAGLGAVTGNKKLQKWGGILGLAGGVAGLATGAWASTASSVAEGAARESFRAAELGAQSLGDVAGAAAGGLGDAAGGLLQANLGVTDIGIGGASAGGFNPMTPGIAGPAVPGPTMPTTVNLVNGGGTTATAPGMQGVMDVAKSKISDLTANSEVGGGILSSMGSKVKPAFEWMEKNPRITQAGAGLLQSGLSAYGQQEALKEQMRLQDDAQARARKRLSDSVQGVTVPVYQRKGP